MYFSNTIHSSKTRAITATVAAMFMVIMLIGSAGAATQGEGQATTNNNSIKKPATYAECMDAIKKAKHFDDESNLKNKINGLLNKQNNLLQKTSDKAEKLTDGQKAVVLPFIQGNQTLIDAAKKQVAANRDIGYLQDIYCKAAFSSRPKHNFAYQKVFMLAALNRISESNVKFQKQLDNPYNSKVKNGIFKAEITQRIKQAKKLAKANQELVTQASTDVLNTPYSDSAKTLKKPANLDQIKQNRVDAMRLYQESLPLHVAGKDYQPDGTATVQSITLTDNNGKKLDGGYSAARKATVTFKIGGKEETVNLERQDGTHGWNIVKASDKTQDTNSSDKADN